MGTLLDLPVGMVPPKPGQAGRILVGGEGLRGPGPASPAWLVILAVANPGWWPVGGADLIAPVPFTFPGRQVHAAAIYPQPTVRPRARPAPAPTVRLPAPGSVRLEFSSDFLLRPGEGYAVTVLLTGLPAHSDPVRQHGALANGKIITRPDTDNYSSRTA